MSIDKRTVATDALETLGEIIDATAGRDAIHIAVEPVQAAAKLFAGQDIGMTTDGAVPASTDGVKAIGIVDPFLRETVYPGQWFWLLVYPRQITSLRHVWEHPDFAESESQQLKPDKATSEAWLRDFIDRSDCPSYETVVAEAVDRRDSWDEYLHFNGSDAHGEIPSEFWDHIEVVTGTPVPRDERARYFSCSC